MGPIKYEADLARPPSMTQREGEPCLRHAECLLGYCHEVRHTCAVRSEDDPCTSSNQCAGALVCDSLRRRCTSRVLAEPPLHAGCTKRGDCTAGEWCDAERSGECRRKRDVGEKCWAGEGGQTCLDGLTCLMNACAPLCREKTDCAMADRMTVACEKADGAALGTCQYASQSPGSAGQDRTMLVCLVICAAVAGLALLLLAATYGMLYVKHRRAKTGGLWLRAVWPFPAQDPGQGSAKSPPLPHRPPKWPDRDDFKSPMV